MTDNIYDVAVIGAGVNGAGIARDAVMRSLKTVLIEQGDIAQATSSASTKLIHGGLRYLEYYDFKLVRESLLERQKLLNIAPHIIWPLEFRLPHQPNVRPFWMIRLGLYLYDALSLSFSQKNTVGFSRTFKNRSQDLKKKDQKIISYRDCWVDDARLVILNVKDAALQGLDVYLHTRCENISYRDNLWHVEIKNKNETKHIKAKTIVNAAGPWVHKLLQESALLAPSTPSVRLVQGSHIIVPRYLTGDHAWILQQPDKRIIFAIPYEDEFTLIGTTETDVTDDPSNAHITEQEIDYLLSAVNNYFETQITRNDVRHTYSGVRPLFDDKSQDARAVTRDYKLYETRRDNALMVSVFGGKLTTYRHLAKDVVDKLCDNLRVEKECTTDHRPLPGGDVDVAEVHNYILHLSQNFPQHDQKYIKRLWRCYGTQAQKILQSPQGQHFGADLFQAEVDYLVQEEWAQSAEDILFRRTKCGLHITNRNHQDLENYLSTRISHE